MLLFNNVTALLARLLDINDWVNGAGEVIPPQREFFYVGGEYQNLSVSHAKFTTELFPPNYIYYTLKRYAEFYSDFLQGNMSCMTSERNNL